MTPSEVLAACQRAALSKLPGAYAAVYPVPTIQHGRYVRKQLCAPVSRDTGTSDIAEDS